MIEIKRWDTGEVIYSGEFSSVKDCLEAGVSKAINFCYANLNGAELNSANLNNAQMNYANLNNAELNNAELNGAQLYGAQINSVFACIPSGEPYYIFISGQVVVAGCQSHSPEAWKNFTECEIKNMDGDKALDFYPRLLKLIDFFLG